MFKVVENIQKKIRTKTLHKKYTKFEKVYKNLQKSEIFY